MQLPSFFARVLDLIAPPRNTDVIVRALSLDELHTLLLRGAHSGSLPYHAAPVRALVWEVKYYASAHATALAGHILADVLVGIASEQLGTPLLVPVPMHTARKHMRGHNQTEVLAQAALAHMPGLYDYTPHALVRTKAALHQQGLSKYERLHNIEGSMKATADIVRGRVCVVLDDVCTTGATFAEATRALHAAGARAVECVALAYS